MKKIFTLMAAAVMALAANAKDYNDKLVLTVTLGTGDPSTLEQQATISIDEVENSDGLYNVTLNDFSFEDKNLGDIKIANVKGNSDSDGFVNFEKVEQTVDIQLGSIPATANVTLNEGSRMKGDKLYLDLDITAMVFVKVHAVFGDNNFPKEYTDKRLVTFNNQTFDPMDATISMQEQADGKYTLSLKNFMIEMMPGYAMGIGNITVKDVTGEETDGTIKLTASQQAVEITPGDDASIDWSFGEQLAQASLKADINGEIADGKLNVKIELPAAMVTVLFGEKYTTGISRPTTTTDNSVEAIYDLSGRKLDEMQKGVNIIRKADGTTVKVLKK